MTRQTWFSRKGMVSLWVAAAFALIVASASAQSAPSSVVITGDAARRALTKGVLSGAAAEKISQACQEYAVQHNFAAVIFILDPYGNIVHAHRMDGIRPVQFESAIDKAKTSLFTRTATTLLAAQVGNDVSQQVRYRMRGLDLGPGGVPIIVNNQLIGSIGVAGSDPLDEPCVAAGFAAVGISMPPTGPSPAPPPPPAR